MTGEHATPRFGSLGRKFFGLEHWIMTAFSPRRRFELWRLPNQTSRFPSLAFGFP